MTPSPVIVIDPAIEAGRLADLFHSLSQALDEFRTSDDIPAGTTPEQLASLKLQAQQLEDLSHLFTAKAIGATLQSVQTDLAKIKSVTADATAQLSVLNNISKVIAIATAAVSIGTAIASGNIGAIGGDADALAQAVAS